MIIRRLLFLFLLLEWSSLLSSIVIVDAKLFLWSSPSSLQSESSKEEKKGQNQKNGRGGIRDRLKLFHKHDDEETATAAAPYNLSPTKYLNIMFLYVRSSIREMTEYLYSSSDQSSTANSPSAYALFRHAQYKDMLSEPRDAWEGFLSAFAALRTGYFGGVHSLIDGVYELGYGTISACIALFTGGAQSNNNMLSFAFLSELFSGLHRGVNHATDGLYLFAAGAVVGTRSLMMGIYRTPEAIRAYQQGKMYYPRGNVQQDNYNPDQKEEPVAVWDYYSLDYEDGQIHLEEQKLKEHGLYHQAHHDKKKDTTTRNIRRRHGVSVKDSKFYDVLGVATDANPKEIRSAYRKEALKHHPDKQTVQSTPSIDEDALPDNPHIEGFLDLTEAYRILSNDASRDAYDQHGLCFREEAILPEEGSHDDYIDLVDELFGASAVQDYVGNILVAPIVNEMFGFQKNNHDSNRESVEIQKLQQRRRTIDIAKYLRDRVNSYVCGDMTIDQFADSCRKEANFILQEGGEPTAAFLRVIGRTLVGEANQRTGHVLPFVRKKFSDSSQKVKSSIANARVYAPIYFRAALEGLVLGSFKNGENDDPGDCSGSRRSDKEPVNQDAVLDLLWQYVVSDTVATLREACEKMFADRGTRDASLAFVQTPSLIRYQKAQRAKAINILAREMLAAGAEVS